MGANGMMPGNSGRRPVRLRLLIAAGAAAIALSGCTTSGKSGSADESAIKETAASKGRSANAGETASSSYTDPAVVSASSAAYDADGMVADGVQAAPDPDSFAGDAMAAGVVTQPTGIRAGSASIFSGSVAVAAPATDAPAPAMAGRGINARTGSVFSAPAQYPSESCGTDIDGNPLSC